MLKKLSHAISLIVDDVLAIGGVGFLSYGAFSIYVPAGCIVLGICLIAVAYLVAKKGATNKSL